MPEFVLDLGSSQRAFSRLDEFTQGYIEAMFWTESGEPDSACYESSFDDLSPEAYKTIIENCFSFQLRAKELLEKYTEFYPMSYAGHDFWLTRSHHGAGFWDRDLGDLGDELTTLAHTYGEVYVYRGDDEKIYT